MKFLIWFKIKSLELQNRFQLSKVSAVMRKAVSMNDNKGEARLWGDSETVDEVGRFFEKHKQALLTILEIRKVTGRDTAQGFYDDMQKCFIELELKRDRAKKELQAKSFTETEKKKRELLKKYA